MRRPWEVGEVFGITVTTRHRARPSTEPAAPPAVPYAADRSGGPVAVVHVRGDVDLHSGPQLRDVLRQLLPDLPGSSSAGSGRGPLAPTPAHRGEARRGAGDSETLPHLSTGQLPSNAQEAFENASDEVAAVAAVVVDLGEVDFIDSYALGVLVMGHKLSRTGGRSYAVVATHPMLTTLFEVTGLARVMPLQPDVPTALAYLRPYQSG